MSCRVRQKHNTIARFATPSCWPFATDFPTKIYIVDSHLILLQQPHKHKTSSQNFQNHFKYFLKKINLIRQLRVNYSLNNKNVKNIFFDTALKVFVWKTFSLPPILTLHFGNNYYNILMKQLNIIIRFMNIHIFILKSVINLTRCLVL